MIVKELTVLNNAGFHVRCSMEICKIAMKYQSKLSLSKGGSYEADCKSALDLLALMAPKDSVLTLRASGDDAEQAVAEIQELFEKKFYEDEFAPKETDKN